MLLLTAGNREAFAQFLFRPRKKAEPRIRDNVFTSEGRSLVGICEAVDIEKGIREAVGLIGGFGKLGIKGKTVLVKPNVVSGEKNPATTNPAVVAAAVRILYQEGASRVYVGDMSAFRTLSTLRNMEKCGIKKAAEENGAEVVRFEDYSWREVRLPQNRFITSAYVTEWIYRTDLIVNLPVIKTHRSASYSVTLKNFIGCTHLRQRPYLIDPSHWEEIVAEFNSAYTPDINIVDGTVSMIEGGPWGGTPAATNLIIASADRVAADVAGLGLIKSFGKWEMVASKDVWAQKQIMTAVALGIGRSKENIRLVEGKGSFEFEALVKEVRRHTGLA